MLDATDRRADVVPLLRSAADAHAANIEAATGSRPSHSPDASTVRREANRRHRLAQLTRTDGPASPERLGWYRAELLPALAAVSLPSIARASGVSTSAASKWRRGVSVPATWHWTTLADLAGLEPRPR